jgi:hypothetical protein
MLLRRVSHGVPGPHIKRTMHGLQRGYAKVALAGARDQIAAQDGGVVDGYPLEIGEKRMSNSFVYNGTRTMYEQAGFEYVRSKGLKNTVMRPTIRPP